MATHKKRVDFRTSEGGMRAIATLNVMVSDDSYVTEPSFIADSEKYPDNLIPFIDKHMNYLLSHPYINPDHYLSNLKLMSRLRR